MAEMFASWLSAVSLEQCILYTRYSANIFTQGMNEQQKKQEPQPLDNQKVTEMTPLGTHPLPLTHLTCSRGVRGMDSLKG